MVTLDGDVALEDRSPNSSQVLLCGVCGADCVELMHYLCLVTQMMSWIVVL